MILVYAIIAFAYVIGLCIGSFLNVVILRSLSEESIVFPASKCPKCQHPLKWYHNIPVFSFIFLKGKCAFCGEKISVQYPLVELFTATIFVFIIMKFGLSWMTLFMWIVSSLLIVMAVTDIKERVVFDKHTLSLMGIGLLNAGLITGIYAYSLHQNHALGQYIKPLLLQGPFTMAIAGALCGALVMEILARLGYLFVGTRAFGEGDSYIAAGLGAVFGFPTVLILLAISVIIQAVLTLPVFIKKSFLNKEYNILYALSGFLAYAVVFGILTYRGIIVDITWLYITLTVLFALVGLFLCYLIIRSIKNGNDSNMTYLPFGPAMVIAAFIAILL